MEKRKEKKNWLEWIVTFISTAIVFFSIGILVYQIIVSEEMPPNIIISLGKVETTNNQYTIPVTVKNKGDKTAQKLRVAFTLENGTGNEKTLLEFDYVPGKSTVKGLIGFSNNPTGKDLKSYILGYVVH